MNIFGAMAHSPATLESYVRLEGALSEESTLGPKVRQALHLRISAISDCSYCRAAYTGACRQAGWSEDEAAAIEDGSYSGDAKVAQLLTFVTELVEHEGYVDDGTWEATKEAGWSEQELLDAFAEVPRTLFTNWFNHLVDTPLDDALTG